MPPGERPPARSRLRAATALIALGFLAAAVVARDEDPTRPGWDAPGAAPVASSSPSLFVRDAAAGGQIRYRVVGGAASVGPSGARVVVPLPGGGRAWAVEQTLVGAGRSTPVGRRPDAARVSYFTGPAERWRTGLPTYRRVALPEAWPGIDVVYGAGADALKYTFRLRAGADPDDIWVAYRGARALRVTPAGHLEASTPAGTLRDHAPVAWQIVDGRRVQVPVRFVVGEDRTYGFRVGEYDRRQPLVIDPEIVYSGFLGGSRYDQGFPIAVDGAGNAYLAGRTKSTDFPATGGSGFTSSGFDAFVAKVSADGSLLYAVYLGGDRDEQAFGITVDGDGSAYLTGETLSAEDSFPVTGGPDLTFNDREFIIGDAFVAKVDPTGTSLEYAGYIGGHLGDEGKDIAVDAAGNAYVVGHSISHQGTFPVTVGPDLTFNGGEYPLGDAFVAKVTADGSSLAYAGYVGGSRPEVGYAIAVDGAGRAHIGGDTASSLEDGFPVNGGPGRTYGGGEWDAFVAGVAPNGVSLEYAGYLGGSDMDNLRSLDLDDTGNLYAAGHTRSANFPAAVGPDLEYNGGDDNSGDGFVAKLTPDLTIAYAGYIGGALGDRAYGIAVDGSGRALVGGDTASPEDSFPVAGGSDLTFGGGLLDGFVAAVAPDGTHLEFAGYLGGVKLDRAARVAVRGGNLYVTGQTYSNERTFPVTGGPDLSHNGDSDAFVVRLCLDCGAPPPPPPPTECTITGTPGDDSLRGTAGDDAICGLGGNDSIKGMGGNDVIFGGPGDDRIDGGDGNDTLHGQEGADALRGGAGADALHGGDGDDRLDGVDQVSGNDSLDGGAGRDRCQADPGDASVACE